MGDILAISGGEASRGADPWKGRHYASDFDRTTGEKCSRLNTGVTFTEEDMKDVITRHNDPLVIINIFSAKVIDNTNVHLHRVLVDTGASVDVLYWNTFIDLGLFRADLLPSKTPV